MTKQDLEGFQTKHCGKAAKLVHSSSLQYFFFKQQFLAGKTQMTSRKKSLQGKGQVGFFESSPKTLAERRNGHLVICVHVRVNDHWLWTSAPLRVLSRGRPVPGMTGTLKTFPQQMDIYEWTSWQQFVSC